MLRVFRVGCLGCLGCLGFWVQGLGFGFRVYLEVHGTYQPIITVLTTHYKPLKCPGMVISTVTSTAMIG